MSDSYSRKNDEITKEIVENYVVLSKSRDGWTREVNLVSWNGRPPKLDVRDWSPEHNVCGKGITLTKEEAAELQKAIDLYLVDPTELGDALQQISEPDQLPFDL